MELEAQGGPKCIGHKAQPGELSPRGCAAQCVNPALQVHTQSLARKVG